MKRSRILKNVKQMLSQLLYIITLIEVYSFLLKQIKFLYYVQLF